MAGSPFLSALVEGARYNPQVGMRDNIDENLTRANDTLNTRHQYQQRAIQMNRALQDWQQQQAILRQRATQQPQRPLLWPVHSSADME